MEKPERQKLIKKLFVEALELEPHQLDSFLFEMCADDIQLREEVESLLNAYNRSENFMQKSAFASSASKIANQALKESELTLEGERLGAYLLLREIGRGGMATVYLAVRNDGEFEQKVAVKVIKRGMDTEEILRRFRQERQILADFNHPNIARLFDGGITLDGRPFFALEYVEGEPINKYAESCQLIIKERLKLFLAVCEAVEYAHERQILHRDLKPDNILVTENGMPKLLDFGIAKLFKKDKTSKNSTATAFEFRVMTPEYSSPEQLRGLPLTPASDVYSLGILLYELLTGLHPYEFLTRESHEILQTINDNEPPKPSEIFNIRNDGANPKELPENQKTKSKNQKQLNGDLDNIILMAIRKEPERRYLSVGEFASDIERYLNNLPILARKNGFSYRSRKFFKRNRTAVLSAIVVAFAFLLIGFSLSFFGGRVSDKQSVASTASSLAGSNLPIVKLKGGSSNKEARNLYSRAQSLWEQRTLLALRQSAELFQQATEKDPDFALAYSGLSNSYFLLSVWGNIPPKEAFPKAKAVSLKAIELAPEVAEGHLSLAMVHWLYEYDWQAADREFKKAIELNPNYARAPHWYGLFLAEMGRFEDAIESEKRALEIEPQSLPVNADLARVLYYARRYDESLSQYRKTIAMNPNFDAFYWELRELFEAKGMWKEWYEISDKINEFRNPVFREAFLSGGVSGYRRKVIEISFQDKVAAYSDYYARATFHAQLGENDLAIEFLNKAFEIRSHRMAQLKVNPKLDNLRSDPRFIELLQRMNFSN